MLHDWGLPKQDIQRTLQAFRDHDERMLVDQLAVAGNERAMIQTAQQASEELQSLFEADVTADGAASGKTGTKPVAQAAE